MIRPTRESRSPTHDRRGSSIVAFPLDLPDRNATPVLDGEVRETQLFNLSKNPNEFIAEHDKDGSMQTDLAENPKYAKQLARMEALLLSEMRRLDDPYRLWNQPDDGLPPPPSPKPRQKKNKKNAAKK